MLKRFANLWTFLAVFCACYFLETITFTYLITAVTSVERQFHIPSRQSGTLIAASDIGYVLTVVFLAYFGSKGNRAKWIGGGCLCISLACAIGSLPGLIFPAKDRTFDFEFVRNALTPKILNMDGQNQDDIIQMNFNQTAVNLSDVEASDLKNLAKLPFIVCDENVRKVRDAIKEEMCMDKSAASGTHLLGYIIVFVAVALIGVGHSTPWTLGMPLIDDNVSKKDTPFFFAGVFFIRIMGPVLGFMIGGWSNKLYITLSPPRGASPSDPSWIGAWWLGFLIVSGCLFVPSLILFCFPRIDYKFKRKQEGEDEAGQETGVKLLEKTDEESVPVSDDNVGPCCSVDNKAGSTAKAVETELAQFGSALCKCLKSPVYVGCLLGRLFDAFAFKGFFVFQPKYLQHHYGVPQYKTNFYMAMMGIIGFAFGVLFGSVAMRVFKMEGRRAAAYVGVASLISALLSFSVILLSCDSVNNQINRDGIFGSPCNSDCRCSDNQSLFPVCDQYGNAYFSPCHAGCRRISLGPGNNGTSFRMEDCTCVPDNGHVSKEFCQDDCSGVFIYYIIISIASGIVSGSQVIPGILILFRSVSKDVRSIALGFLGFMVSLFSTFPSPIVFGSIIDTTCKLWESTCGARGACLLYDSTLIRVRMHVFQAILRASGLLFDIWNWYYAKDMKLMEEVEEKDVKKASPSPTQDKRAGGEKTFKPPSLGMPLIVEPRRHKRSNSATSPQDDRRRSSILHAIEQFGSLYELEMKAQPTTETSKKVEQRRSFDDN
uniref:Solute carrier organic anion transporter family member n=1 Tax=Romanomermis culicivorax TaxID=13658 RepID=A0A915JN74_ROMCU